MLVRGRGSHNDVNIEYAQQNVNQNIRSKVVLTEE